MIPIVELQVSDPAALVAIRSINQFPWVNVKIGFWSVLMVTGVLLPKRLVAFHCQEVGVLVDVSVKTRSNEATGGGVS